MLIAPAPELSDGPASPSSWGRAGSMSRAEPMPFFQRTSYASSSSHNSIVPTLGSVPPAVPPAASAPYLTAFVAASCSAAKGRRGSSDAVSAAPGSSANGRKRLHQEEATDAEDRESKQDSKQLCSISAHTVQQQQAQQSQAWYSSPANSAGRAAPCAAEVSGIGVAAAFAAAAPVAVAAACMKGGDDDAGEAGEADMPRLQRPSQQPSQRRLLKMVTTSLESGEFAHLNAAIQEAEQHRGAASVAAEPRLGGSAAPADSIPAALACRSSSHGRAFIATAEALEDAPALPGRLHGLHAQQAVPLVSPPHTSQRHQDAGRLRGFLGHAAGGGHAAAASAVPPKASTHARYAHAHHGLLVQGLLDGRSEEDVYGTGWETPPLETGNSLLVLDDHLDLALVSLSSTATASGADAGGNATYGGGSSRGGGCGGVGALRWLGD
ncbi:hypothetical protein HYH02_000365 [Chlamydomonas schloesseri]|uniref:Uncharacterized protein n=1 Tax=Chlamydomonas schloesseri TaxID=2026947 RepID=A0A835WWL1_9CHLO|nr:hypothetical protein HYH02_000365 [Chlamydomonas schloesseri]|eukprot:KAG2454518.1 hypothetical protein HYH02_000365 [Chlamydomonas schloesseri]